MKTQADFQEKLNILTAILFPGPPSADTGPEILPSVPEGADHETLLCFGRALARHREFLKGQYEIFLPEEAEISGDILTIAREQQGVCSYGLDLASGKILYLDPAGVAEPLDLSLEDFLLYLTALQSSGFCPCSGRIEDCSKLLKEKFSDRRITDTSKEGEVSLLIWEQLSECLLTTFNGIRENHLTHSNNLLVIEEHVLCTSQTDTLCTECTSYLSIVWCVSIGTHLKLGVFVAEIHELLEVARKLSSLCRNLSCVNLTG